jgi:hypothetical protein
MFSKKLSMKTIAARSVLAAALVAVWANGANAATTYFKLADEWGTIMPAGPRTGVNGVRFWNAEGSGNGANASTAPFRFYTADIVSQANAEYGVGGWTVTNVNIVLSQNNASFTRPGMVKLYSFANDALAITNGVDDSASAAPGLFAALGTSQLRYASGANLLDTQLADGTTDVSTIFGNVNLLDSYQFTGNGSAGNWPLDVLAPRVNGVGDHVLLNPEGELAVGSPSYGISPPIVNPTRAFRSDTAANFDAYAERVGTNLNITPIAAELEAGSGALSLMLVAPDASTAATYRGGPFGGDYPARIYIEVSPKTSPLHPGDFDADGDVDGADFVAWQTNFPKESGATPAQGDADNDGDVDGADFVVWQTNFPFTPSGGTSAVPEPSALVLCIGLGLSALALKRRKRS